MKVNTETASNPMTREELLELAALDALGLLDEYEAALYTRSFHHAPATVQDEIRDLQAAVAADGALLPDVRPRSEMRTMVLDAVAAAIERDSEDFSPLALIGRPRRESDGRARTAVLSGGGQFWRAASFILIGALVVAAYFTFQFRAENAQLHDLAIQAYTQAEVTGWFADEMRDRYLHNSNCLRIPLASRPGEEGRVGMIYVDETAGAAFVLCQHVPAGTDIRVTARDDDGDLIVDRFVKAQGMIAGLEIRNASINVAALTWTISDAETGVTLLTNV